MSRVFTNSILILALAVPLAADVLSGQTVAKPKPPGHKKHAPTKKIGPPPPPTRIAPMTPEELPAQAPQVSYLNGQLTILSQNSTLADVLSSVQQKTGVVIDVPPGAGKQRVAAQIGPASPRDALTSLLQGTNLDYIILGDDNHPGAIKKVVLTSGSGASGANVANNNVPGNNSAQNAPPQESADPDNAGDDQANSEPQPEPPPPDQPSQDQPPRGAPGMQGQQPGEAPPNAGQTPNGQMGQGQQQGVKTPEQMLQELQQMRQAQQQQQQQSNN